MTRSVLLVEDDPVLGQALVQRLSLEGVRVRWSQTAGEGIQALRQERPDLVVCDIKLPDLSGEALFFEVLPELGSTPVVFATAFGELEQAVRLIRAGADDYLTKPFSASVILDKLASIGRPPMETRAPEPQAGEPLGWRSPAMREVARVLGKLADLETTVLLLGETGTGKEVAARHLHRISRRASAPFVAVNCGAIPDELMESQVFGHERGAFTGAAARHAGFAEQAGEGTLFLDEIGELPLALQPKLLRLLQERRFTRVGGSGEQVFRARIVSATNADLAARVAEGRFREDLYHRLNVVPVLLPPLRERSEDLRALFDAFVTEFAEAFGRARPAVDPDLEEALTRHRWPGNVRELRNRVERAMALMEGAVIGASDLFPEQSLVTGLGGGGGVASLAEARDAAEREHIQAALRQAGGQVTRAADLLRISRSTLFEKIKRLGIEVAE